VTAPNRQDRAGETVGGKYRVVRFLAEGGMAAVYEARHLVVNRRFAIKFLRADLAAQRGALERFQREASVAGSLEQENVAAVMDFGVAADGAPFIVMEYLAGETLAALLRRQGRLPVARAADLCVQACFGLAAAHAAGVVHRDLKPQNLFVCRRPDGSDLLKVLDFGVAKLEEAESRGMVTATGATLGTPFYMAPEQARGEGVCDERTDVYGLGAVVYELLSGRRPHNGDSNNAVLHHICTQPAVPLAEVAPDVTPELAAVVHRCLAGVPADRFNSMGALAEALRPFAGRQAWPAPASLPDVTPVPTPPTSTERPPVRRRRPWLLLSLALLGAAAVGVYSLKGHAPKRQLTTLPHDTQFFVPSVQPGATAQIASLVASPRAASALTAMTSTPRGLWLIGGAPDEVRAVVHKTMVRAMREKRVPILVPYNHPYRDCAGYGAGGTEDLAAYRSWIDALVAGLGNEQAVVILEPHSLGIIPNVRRLNGELDWCRPSATDGQGEMAPAKGATPADRYALLNDALDRLASGAPRTRVYLDGTHSAWLSVGDSAYRLARAGIDKAQGFTVNVSSFETTADSIQYGTWIAKCLAYAQVPANRHRGEQAYAECASRSPSKSAAEVEAWYAAHVDPLLAGAGAPPLAHFVIDTSRNGRGPLDVSQFGRPPYNQPQDVLDKLAGMRWCNPPGATQGHVPTVNTGVPLVDAFLWVKNPGESDGSCNIAGGGRDWDYARHNPWGISGEALAYFDPLWGMVDPAVGEWFPAQALQLALGGRPAEVP
jgi:endoglucanase